MQGVKNTALEIIEALKNTLSLVSAVYASNSSKSFAFEFFAL